MGFSLKTILFKIVLIYFTFSFISGLHFSAILVPLSSGEHNKNILIYSKSKGMNLLDWIITEQLFLFLFLVSISLLYTTPFLLALSSSLNK